MLYLTPSVSFFSSTFRLRRRVGKSQNERFLHHSFLNVNKTDAQNVIQHEQDEAGDGCKRK